MEELRPDQLLRCAGYGFKTIDRLSGNKFARQIHHSVDSIIYFWQL
jgi:hypothetical protein